MTSDIYWLLELEIKDGRRDALTALMTEMVEATQANEPDTIAYEWSIDEAGKTCHIYERYRDSAAVMTHLGTFGERFAGRFLDILTPVRLSVYGAPSEEVRAALAGLGAVHYAITAGFSR